MTVHVALSAWLIRLCRTAGTGDEADVRLALLQAFSLWARSCPWRLPAMRVRYQHLWDMASRRHIFFTSTCAVTCTSLPANIGSVIGGVSSS